jgi:protein phosphatase
MMTRGDQPHHRSTGETQTGNVRADNQDAILMDEAVGLWIVADGMGGHEGGAEASRLAIAKVREAILEGRSLHQAILTAHEAISARQEAEPGLSAMGTTIVAVLDQDNGYEINWVGDSRAYLFDRASASLEKLTRDHNLAGLLVEAGRISASEADRHPKRHVLTDCLGIRSQEAPRIDQYRGCWKAGQLLLLCSDGLSGELPKDSIARVLCEERSIDRAVSRLMNEALEAGARDNVSLVLIESPIAA